eukprot:SAG22_NODE_138_length_18031_cov_5.796621_11_plen_67_part_00
MSRYTRGDGTPLAPEQLDAARGAGMLDARLKGCLGLPLEPAEEAELQTEREDADRWIARVAGAHSN